MSKKVSISLPEHVYRLASRKSKLTHGENNFSGYIRDLVCKEFTEDDLERELKELKKPLYLGPIKEAGFDSICKVCENPIVEGDKISRTDLGFQDDYENWVHKDCCRKD